MNSDKALWQASRVFAPDYPRQSSNGYTIQDGRGSRPEFCEALEGARDGEMPGYYSVYSFPRGHSRDGNVPKVDCIFIDLDVEGDNYDPNNDETDFDAWQRDMSALLARARMIANAILDAGEEEHYRVVLSGHKGLHLYLDFPTIAPNNGGFQQFKNGLKSYGESVMKWLDSTAGGVNIDRWVDVDASDLGRLARHPNTIHHGAAYDDETRWCVPITMAELSELTVEDYLRFTEGPRWIEGYQRNPSDTAGEKVVQAIREASTGHSGGNGSSQPDPAALSEYEETVNDEIELEDISFLTSNKPCIEAFRQRDDAYGHGSASHTMEISIMARFVELGVPRSVMHEFFAEIPRYEEAQTNEEIDRIISRKYKEFDCASIATRAPTFCLGDDCSVYRRADDIQK